MAADKSWTPRNWFFVGAEEKMKATTLIFLRLNLVLRILRELGVAADRFHETVLNRSQPGANIILKPKGAFTVWGDENIEEFWPNIDLLSIDLYLRANRTSNP